MNSVFYLKQSAVILLFNFLVFQIPLSASDIKLPHLTTVIQSSSRVTKLELTEEDLENFSSTEEALESTGLSFKESNNEVTFHGLWNSSIKVYINGILMNDPNTGKFDFSTLDISSVRSIKVDPVSTDGAVSVYIETLLPDYTKIGFTFGGESKSYFSFHNISPNDSWRLHGNINYPLIFKDGSSLMFQENFSGGYYANHFGFLSNEASYESSFKDSFAAWKWQYGGWEKKLVNNSFSSVYSSAKLPGITFGFTNYFSWNKQNCGITGGKYYNHERQEDINAVFAFPVFIPSKKLRLKIIPSYKLSNLDYKKEAAYSSAHDVYQIHSFSFSEETTLLKFIKLNARTNYDFSKGNKLFNLFFDPGVSFDWSGFDFTVSSPLNFFYTKNNTSINGNASFDFLYSAEIRKALSFSDNSDNLIFFLNASRNITNPVFQQLYYDGGGGEGNPDLKTESAFSFYAGTEWKEKIDVYLKPFLIFYKDKIGWVPVNGVNWRPENSGSSTNYGFDFSFDSSSLFEKFRLQTNYTLCRAMLTSDEKVYGKQIMYTPLHSLNALFEYEPDDAVKLSLMYNFVSRKFITNDNTSFVPSQHYVDAKVNFKIKKADLYLLFQNILDFKYVEVSGYPGPGASFTAGVKYSY